MEQIVHSINESNLYNKILGKLRNYLSSSKTKEQLNNRLVFFNRLLSPFILNNGPRRKQNTDVNERLEFLLAEVEQGQSIVDVGCFDGYFTQKLREFACETVGVDCLDQVLNKTRKDDPEGNYISGFAENLPLDDNTYDVGIYSHVLEHVFNPELTLAEAKRVIKKNGKIILVVPYGLGCDANHLREYNKRDLKELIGNYFSDIRYYNQIGDGHGCTAINLK